jgi:4'-phosphopantetheinyl transferase
LNPLAIDLWCVHLQVAPAIVADCAALLDVPERERAQRFAFDRDRRRYMVHHAAARVLVSQATSVPARALRWSAGPRGRPAVAGLALAVSLSRSHELGLVAIASDGRIGVDVEAVRAQLPEAAWLAGQVDAGALAREAADASHASSDWFYRGWTRIEALAKARGTGIVADPASNWDPWRELAIPGLIDDLGQPRDWLVQDVEIENTVGMNYRAALATDQALCPVRVHPVPADVLQAWLRAEFRCETFGEVQIP